MNFVELLNAYLAEQSLERTRGYVARGRPLAGLSIEALGVRWVETYRAARVLEEEDREGELLDLRSEFNLRGVGPPLHLLTAEMALFRQRFRQRCEGEIDEVGVEQAEAKFADFQARLQRPKN